MTALYTVAEIREIEKTALAALPPGTLMQRAGRAAAQAALALIAGRQPDTSVLVLAGPGNNGGDALEAASHLAQEGQSVSILLHADPARQSTDAQQALQRARNSRAHFLDPSLFSIETDIEWSLVIDGLFGIGTTRPITGALHKLIEHVNTLACPVLALDVPSGLDADTGNVVGPDGIAVQATHTITFIADKPGLHTCSGRDYTGEVEVADLAIDRKQFAPPHACMNDVPLFAASLHRRRHNSHKGSYGDVVVIGGAQGMRGAPILAARAAAKCGAGRVFAAFLDDVPAYDSVQPELMCRLARDMDFSASTLVAGPGLGTSRQAHDFLARALNSPGALVLDADALNLLATEPGLQQKLTARSGKTLLTPHPLEAARLLAISSSTVQADRLAAARELARRFNAIVALKGSGTIIARQDGFAVVNGTGNPALATAGTGDVLAGICGALLAQDWPIWDAALASVWLHGHAADVLVAQGVGPIGVMAGELLPAVRASLNQLVERYAQRGA